MKQQNLVALILIFVFSCGVFGQARINVRFARGASSATVSGTVRGYRYNDYRVQARSGQTMAARITTTSPFVSFVIFDGQMQNVEGATEVTNWTGTLPTDGIYTVRVLLPRSAARRGTAAAYSLRISIRRDQK